MHRWQGLSVSGSDDLPPFAPPDAPRSRLRTLVELPVLVVTAIVIAFLIKSLVAQAFFIPSESMTPQLEIGDRVVVSRTSYRLHEPNRGDIVVFPRPDVVRDEPPFPVRVVQGALEATGLVQPGEDDLIKRVVGLPGETIEGREGRVHIDGRPLVEPYLTGDVVQGTFGPVDIPGDAVFVMGDNRANSADSRVFGVVEVDDLVGRAIAIVWPPGRAAFL